MSPTGFRWFVCGVVAALVVIMLIVVRSNAAWNGRTLPPDDDRRGAWSGEPPTMGAALASGPLAKWPAG